MKGNLRTILRCTGLALVVIAALVLVPVAAEAQGVGFHGVALLKGNCNSPQSSCNSDSDCDNGDFCDGAETCSTISTTEPTISCQIQLTNSDTFHDSVTLTAACDLADSTSTPTGPLDCILTIFSVVDNGPSVACPDCVANDTTCTAPGTLPCDVGFGDVVTWTTNEYVIQPDDPNPVEDQGRVNWFDMCNDPDTSGCSTALQLATASASTLLVDNCVAGPGDPCTTEEFACANPLCDETANAGAGGCVAGPSLCDATCEECVTDACVPLADPPASCNPDEICRTPGFFGTHGGDEKEEKSQNITLAILNAYNAANVGNELTICGTEISNTECGSPNSALEAICVSPKGNSLLQLGRQLTAAALNCILSNSTGDPTATDPVECTVDASLTGAVCDDTSIEAIFDACNAACAGDPGSVTADVDLDGDPATPDVEVSCIAAIDCFNNGFLLDEFGVCTDDLSGCHEADLDNGCFEDFTPPGAAGSPRECNASRKNCITIFGTIPGCDGGTAPCPDL